jgi:hypothetical protein
VPVFLLRGPGVLEKSFATHKGITPPFITGDLLDFFEAFLDMINSLSK